MKEDGGADKKLDSPPVLVLVFVDCVSFIAQPVITNIKRAITKISDSVFTTVFWFMMTLLSH